MKTILLTLACLCLLSIQSQAQLLSDDQMTFYGLDFSKARMMGEGFANPSEIQSRYFDSWNGFFRSDNKDYDVGEAFDKTVTLDFTNVERNNKTVDVSKLVSNNDYTITPGQAEAVVKGYETTHKGLGCVFVVESFDKARVLATVYVIFFDQATKKIILNKKMEGKPGGFGLKNYWANAVRLILHDSKKDFKK